MLFPSVQARQAMTHAVFLTCANLTNEVPDLDLTHARTNRRQPRSFTCSIACRLPLILGMSLGPLPFKSFRKPQRDCAGFDHSS